KGGGPSRAAANLIIDPPPARAYSGPDPPPWVGSRPLRRSITPHRRPAPAATRASAPFAGPPDHPASTYAMDSWLLELRQAARRLAHLPAFTAAVVLTLGLGLGAIVAAFAVVNAVLLRPLPYPDSERIVTIQHHAPGLNVPELELSEGAVRLYRTWARSLDPLAVYYRLDRNLTGSDRPARVSVVDVSPEFFDVVRTGPAVGTRFTEDDVAPGAEPVAILTDAGWRAHFGADPGVVGRDVEIDGRRTRIIGIMPRGFYVDDPNAVLLMPRRVDPYGSFGTFGLRGIARL